MAVIATADRPARQREARLAKATSVNIRIDAEQLAPIDHAAVALGTNRSAFMLETAVHKAEAVLLDKRLFSVDDDIYDRFMARLDAPPAANPKLHALLARRLRGKNSPVARAASRA